jgi:hypothetical protein
LSPELATIPVTGAVHVISSERDGLAGVCSITCTCGEHFGDRGRDATRRRFNAHIRELIGQRS